MPPLRLAVLDVDGTLKAAESPYQYIHERLGVAAEAAQHRALALARKINYAEWLRRDVSLWAGLPVATMRDWLAENPYVPGACDLLTTLKKAGVYVALVSAGFTLNTDPIMTEFQLDACLSNELGEVDGILDGRAINHVPEGGKGAFVRALMARLGVDLTQTLAAGDTHGDLELFACAGTRIAVNPKDPELRARADLVCEPDLQGVVTWLRQRGALA